MLIIQKASFNMHSEKYLEWVKQCGLGPLTSQQHKFAEFLFEHDKEIAKVGGMEVIFESIRKYLKHETTK